MLSEINTPCIGNDLVCLTEPDNREGFRNIDYLKKMFTTKEYGMFALNNPEPLLYAALCWSCKESAYKIKLQQGFKNAFAPALFEVSVIAYKSINSKLPNNVRCRVNYKNEVFYCRSKITSRYIHTMATDTPVLLKNIYNAVLKTKINEPESLSLKTYHLLLKRVAKKFNTPVENLSIQKDTDGRPFIFNKKNPLQLPFSVSHDGNFLSFAFIK